MKNQDPQKKKILLHVCCAPCAGYVIQRLEEVEEKPKKEPDSEASESGSFLGFSVTPFFYNPNIHPKEEYEKRLNELKKYLTHHHVIPTDPDKIERSENFIGGEEGSPPANRLEPQGDWRAGLSRQDEPMLKYQELIIGEYNADTWHTLTQGLEHEPEKGRRCEICYRLRLKKTAQLAQDKNFDYFASTLTISPHKPADTINQIGLELAEKYNIQFIPADWKKHDGFKKSCLLAKEHDFYRQGYCGCVYSQRRR